MKCLAGTRPTFLARPFAARELESCFGRDVRRKRVPFQCVVLVYFGFLVRFPILGIYRGIFGVSCVKVTKFSRPRLRRSRTRIYVWSGCSPKKSLFLVRCSAAFWSSRTLCHFENVSSYRGMFGDTQQECAQIFSLAPSALAN